MAKACAKVILVAEHAVVYDVPALVCGIERGVEAWAAPAETATLAFAGQHVAVESDHWRALAAVLQRLQAGACQVKVALNMPVGVGLGASAAIGVAVAQAVLEAFGRPLDDELVLAAADAWERVFHGNPSGVDAAAAHHGGCLRYQRGHGAIDVPLGAPLNLLVAVAGPPSSTKEMVAQVAQFRERNAGSFQRNLDAIALLSRNAELCLQAGDLTSLGTLLDYNHMLLAGWFLSTPAIEECRTLARDAGALGSKLTGAGGGGCVVALAGDAGSAPILQAWQQAGFACFESAVAARPKNPPASGALSTPDAHSECC